VKILTLKEATELRAIWACAESVVLIPGAWGRER
jgi:hypothetical protein